MRAALAFILLFAACTRATEGFEHLGSSGGDPTMLATDGGPRPRGDGGPPPGALTLEEYCARAYALEVQKAQDCYNLDPSYTERRLGEQRTRELCEGSVRTGLYTFDPENAAACLDARDAQGCAEYYYPWHFDQLTSCTRALIGAGNEGDACEALDQCGPGLICDVAQPLGACTNRCVPDHGSKREGQTCTTLHDCREELECPSAVIPARACMMHPGAGDRCVPGPINSCEAFTWCSHVTERCVPLRAEGERCQFSEDCEPMLVCVGLQGEERCASGGRVGDSCPNGQGGCNPQAYCTEDNVCVPRGLSEDPCDVNGAARCHEGWFCDPRSSLCRLPRSNGLYCESGNECASALCLDTMCSACE